MIEQEGIKKSPLINTAGLLPDKEIKLLVSCCNVNGGLYIVDFSQSLFQYKKVLDGDCRGIARYHDFFIIPSNTDGLLLLDCNLNIVQRSMPDEPKDFHGVAIEGDYAYVVETRTNTISIYNLPDLIKAGEIVFDSSKEDIRHINDIFIDNHQMFLSMFSPQIKWRDCPTDSGVVIRYDLNDLTNEEPIFSGLKHPHSIRYFEGDIFLCNSSNFGVNKSGTQIFKGNGYLRGLEKIDDTIFIGQSESRNVDWIRKENTNISVDSGLHVFNAKEKISRFFSLPSPEIYAILDCSDVMDQLFFDNATPVEASESIEHMRWKLYIDTGDGFLEEQTLQLGFSSFKNEVRINLDKYQNVKMLRFEPVNAVCLLSLYSISIENENQKKELQLNSHNAIPISDNQYYFNHCNPQLIIDVFETAIETLILDYGLYTDSVEIGNQLTNQLYNTRCYLNSRIDEIQKENTELKSLNLELNQCLVSNTPMDESISIHKGLIARLAGKFKKGDSA